MNVYVVAETALKKLVAVGVFMIPHLTPLFTPVPVAIDLFCEWIRHAGKSSSTPHAEQAVDLIDGAAGCLHMCLPTALTTGCCSADNIFENIPCFLAESFCIC